MRRSLTLSEVPKRQSNEPFSGGIVRLRWMLQPSYAKSADFRRVARQAEQESITVRRARASPLRRVDYLDASGFGRFS